MSGASLAVLLARKRRGAAAVLWAERLVPCALPAVGLLLVLICAGLVGWLGRVPPWPRLALLLLAAGGLAVLLRRGLVRLKPPTFSEIDRRLEAGGNDEHRALAALDDQPACGEAAVWQAHRARALARIASLRPGPPRFSPGDAVAVGIGAVALVACCLAAGDGAVSRLWLALTPRLAWPGPAAPDLQAWIVPPRATGMGPIFLHRGDPAAVVVPTGSQLTVSVIGGTRLPLVRYGGQRQLVRRLDPTSYQATLLLTQPGRLQIARGETIAQWQLAVAADQPPHIRLAGAATQRDGRAMVPWAASDDYGLASVTVEIRLGERPGAAPLRLHVPIDGTPRSAAGAGLPDLTAHPWAGLPALVRYVAQDGAGQRAVTEDVAITLPERVFTNPSARALVLVRRMLVAAPDETVAATAALDRLSATLSGQLPPDQWLNLRGIAALLFEQPDDVDQAEARLWQLAVAIEDGGLGDARQRLADARRALQEALAAPPNPGRQQKIEALATRLQAAMQAYLQSMLRQAARSGQAPPQQDNGRTVDQRQLQQMAQQLADAARAGRTDEAAAQLQQLGALLDTLRPSTKPATGQADAAHGDPALEKLMHDQSALQSDTDRRLSEDADPRATPGPERDPDEAAGEPDPRLQRKQDAGGQSALRKRLGDLAQRLGESTGQIPAGLAHADTAMRDAAGALSRGDDTAARAAQQRAQDGLRDGSAQLARQQNGGGQGSGPGGTAGQGQPGPGDDPLGRPLAEGGQSLDSDEVTLPANASASRSRALRDELRRRAADRTRPPQELDYIDRLLKPE